MFSLFFVRMCFFNQSLSRELLTVLFMWGVLSSRLLWRVTVYAKWHWSTRHSRSLIRQEGPVLGLCIGPPRPRICVPISAGDYQNISWGSSIVSFLCSCVKEPLFTAMFLCAPLGGVIFPPQVLFMAASRRLPGKVQQSVFLEIYEKCMNGWKEGIEKYLWPERDRTLTVTWVQSNSVTVATFSGEGTFIWRWGSLGSLFCKQAASGELFYKVKESGARCTKDKGRWKPW